MGTISTIFAQLQKTKYNLSRNTQEEESIEESLKAVTDPADVSHRDRYVILYHPGPNKLKSNYSIGKEIELQKILFTLIHLL